MTAVALEAPIRKTRIQKDREKVVLDSALQVFARFGFHGATIDQIAAKAELSKPNVLYYFKSKSQIYTVLLERTLEGWLDPFIAMDANGDPLVELEKYVSAKMDMSFDNPLPSRLFAIEIMNGAPHLKKTMHGPLRSVVEDKVKVLRAWMASGKLKTVDPYHLIFSIWSVTQHYADFANQIEAVLGAPPDRKTAKAAAIDILLGGLKP